MKVLEMVKITLFKDFSDTTNPKYVDIDYVLNSIKDCKIQKQVDEIRACTDSKVKSTLKKKLPCVLFSGEFSQRNDASLIKHSGYVVLDFDHIENLKEKKDFICSFDFVYSCFLSPSGDGLKVVVVIPNEKEKHRGYYKGLMQVFTDLDPTNINESRICFMSADKDLYLNKNAIPFVNYIEVLTQSINKNVEYKNATFDNYSKAEVALKIIRNSIKGEYHKDLLKASKLMGGFVAGGFITESEAVRLLEKEIQLKDIDSFEDAKTTIKKGIQYGIAEPISEQEKYEQPKIILENKNDLLADKKEIDKYLFQWRNNTFEKGLTTGLPSFDKYFLFKRGNFNVVNGFDNVGKSTALWYLTLLSAMFHNWSWVIYSNENKAGSIYKKMIEFYWGTPIVSLSESQYKKGYEFVSKHFTFISNDYL
jgi:hypothetical protein